MKTIILASASPRRKELLGKIGLRFKVEPSNYEENMHSTLEPHELAQKISLEKAEAVASKHKNAIVIAADTSRLYESTKEGETLRWSLKFGQLVKVWFCFLK